MTELSVVLISRNQGSNMDRLIQSVLRATSAVPNPEIVLVDSTSSDHSIDVARQYPITVLQLQPGQVITPSAGRWAGYHHTTGELVLFLDGDMELAQGWLPIALQVMRNRADAGAVSGHVIDVPEQTPPDSPNEVNPARHDNGLREVPHGGGAAMYRRSALDKVGTFNPYLYSDEEPELCLRLRQAGYRIFQVQRPISFHHSSVREKISTVIARRQRNLYLGCGQNLRYKLGTEYFWPYVQERGHGLLPVGGLAAGVGALAVGAATRRWWPFRMWGALVGLLVLVDAIRKRSLQRPLVSLLKRVAIAEGTIRGFFREPMDPDTYPGRLQVIRLQENQVLEVEVATELRQDHKNELPA